MSVVAVRSVTEPVLVERTKHAAKIAGGVKHRVSDQLDLHRERSKVKLCPHVGDYNQQGHCKNIPVVPYNIA